MKSNLVSNQRIRFIYLNGIDKSWKVFHFGSSLTKQFYFSKLTWWLCTKTMCCSKRKHQSQVPHCEMGARCMRITLSYYSHCMYVHPAVKVTFSSFLQELVLKKHKSVTLFPKGCQIATKYI